jgi:FkbM family methyltransferase
MRDHHWLSAWKAPIQDAVERSLRITISRPQHGVRECADIAACGCQVRTIFDVGANIGQTARRFRTAFPKAVIHCFEPVEETFHTLTHNLARDHSIFCHRLALSDRAGDAHIFVTENSSTCSLLTPDQFVREELVTVATVDTFSAAQGIARIDLLKIDAEGNDLNVLRGAEGMLSRSDVAFVLAEVGFTPGDDRHVLFDDVRDLLSPYGFRLFGIYGQQPEWTGERRLRFANALFSRE